uniref:calcium homeostasis modulator protein 6-like isoform X2 n=1 Tax=Pristiophorus japonicus TaxID=55135 RepID=UPI00398F2F39
MAMEKDILSKLKDSLPDIKSGALKVFGNVVLSLILYGFEELMEKEIQCPCALKSNGKYISFTFIIPAILLFLISLLALKDSQIWCKLCQCYKQEDKYKRLLLCLFILMTMVKASTPAMIWVVLLFLDGDYYACSNLMGKNETASVEACVSTCNKNFSEIPVTLQKLCFTSQLIGGILLVGMLAVLLLIYFLRQYAHGCAMKSYDEFEHDCLRIEEEVMLIRTALKNRAVKKAKEGCATKISEIFPSNKQSQTGTQSGPGNEDIELDPLGSHSGLLADEQMGEPATRVNQQAGS